jgi:ABC-type bacteriocin/lantibiotic exporter with double-glycine peptidase domain
MGLVLPLAVAAMFDSIVPNGETARLMELVGGLVAVALGATMFEALRAFALTRVDGRMARALAPAAFDRLMRLPVRFFTSHTSGDLAHRLIGFAAMPRVLARAAASVFAAGVFGLVSLAVLFAMSARLALVATGLAAIPIVLAVVASAAQLRHTRGCSEAEGRLTGLATQLALGMIKLRSAAREQRGAGLWAAQARRRTAHALAARQCEAVQHALTDAYPILAIAVVFFAAVALVPQLTAPLSDFSLGQFLGFNAAFGQLLAAVVAIGPTLSRSIAAVPRYERARPILATLPETSPTRRPARIEGAIEIARVTFRYDRREPVALDDVSIMVAPGEFVAIVGPSGSGKSTLLRLLIGFEVPESGSILFDGVPLDHLDPASVRRQMGVVPQEARLAPGSIYDNIAGHSALGMDDAWEGARSVGFDAEIAAMPAGMHTVVSAGACALSGGQRQQLSIARALAHRPRVLVLDEPTSPLDARVEATLVRSLAQRNVTRIVVTHRPAIMRAADRIVVLERGRVTDSGTYEELMRRGGALVELVRGQSGCA